MRLSGGSPLQRHAARYRPRDRGAIAAGRYRLVFVAPERLLTPRFLQLIERLKVRAFAIDEAHCISHWGHDFRPEYRQLAELKIRFPHASMHAYTATATERVREDIADQLRLHNPAVLVGTFDRPIWSTASFLASMRRRRAGSAAAPSRRGRHRLLHQPKRHRSDGRVVESQ